MSTQLNLTVIRCNDIDTSAAFYQMLGLTFEKHRHGKGPEHYAAEMSACVFELYPANKSYPATTGTRIGFSVDDVDTTIETLREANAQILTEPADSPWGRRAVIVDPDGHKVELTTHPAEQ